MAAGRKPGSHPFHKWCTAGRLWQLVVNRADDLQQQDSDAGVVTTIDKVTDPLTKLPIPNVITTRLPSGLTNVTRMDKSYGSDGTDFSMQTLTVSSNGKAHQLVSDSRAGLQQVTTAANRQVSLTKDPLTGLLRVASVSG
ncbi:MAG: hypothetical protein II007_01605, partial [Gammaproteobacteria bacterium]|nr:hypothetical protein [Gammaproteobacteria bacterium]